VTVTGSRLLNNGAASGGALFNDQNTLNVVSVIGSCIVGNSDVGFFNNQAAQQTATGNWWGAPDGPGPVGPGAVGDTVSVNVDFTGWLIAPILGCPDLTAPPPSGGGGGGAAAAPVVQVSDPAISKAGDPLAAAVGERVTWTIQVWNPGSTPTAPVVFSDTIPPMFDILTVTASRGAVSVSGNTVTVDIGVLQPGERVTILIETVGNDQAAPGRYATRRPPGRSRPLPA
jgi:uncharacterized repeat protein (TIGR01451 family)